MDGFDSCLKLFFIFMIITIACSMICFIYGTCIIEVDDKSVAFYMDNGGSIEIYDGGVHWVGLGNVSDVVTLPKADNTKIIQTATTSDNKNISYIFGVSYSFKLDDNSVKTIKDMRLMTATTTKKKFNAVSPNGVITTTTRNAKTYKDVDDILSGFVSNTISDVMEKHINTLSFEEVYNDKENLKNTILDRSSVMLRECGIINLEVTDFQITV